MRLVWLGATPQALQKAAMNTTSGWAHRNSCFRDRCFPKKDIYRRRFVHAERCSGSISVSEISACRARGSTQDWWRDHRASHLCIHPAAKDVTRAFKGSPVCASRIPVVGEHHRGFRNGVEFEVELEFMIVFDSSFRCWTRQTINAAPKALSIVLKTPHATRSLSQNTTHMYVANNAVPVDQNAEMANM